MSDQKLRKAIIRLASQHPEFRKDLLPLVNRKTATGTVNFTHAARWHGQIHVYSNTGPDENGVVWLVLSMLMGDYGPFKFTASIVNGVLDTFDVLRGGSNVNPGLIGPWREAFVAVLNSGNDFTKLANFPPASIGKEVSGPEGIKGSDADKKWSEDHFTQMWFEELNDKQQEGELSDGVADAPGKFAGLGKFAAGSDVPQKVQDLADTIRDGNPAYNDAQAYATAWSVYCKYVEPNSPHCTLPPSEYLINRAASHSGIRKKLIRLAHGQATFRTGLIPFFKHADEMQSLIKKDADPVSHDQNKPETWNNLPPKGKQATETTPAEYKADADPVSHDQNKPETWNNLPPRGLQARRR